MTTEELRAAYQQDFATVQASIFWMRLSSAQQGRLRALALFCARAPETTMDQLLALISNQPQREEQAMADKTQPATQEEHVLKTFGVPADVVDAAKQVGMDLETLGKLCVNHTVQAVRDFLSWAQGKLPH